MINPTIPFLARTGELLSLAQVMDSALRGESRSIVLCGEAGIGKTSILQEVSERLGPWQVKSCFGVETEMELSWAALHQFCSSMLEYLPRLPLPQRAALECAFGLGGEGVPDPFLCGLAVVSLLAEAVDEGPVLCIVDDAHAVDKASLRTLGFVARRLRSEPVAMLFAVRDVPVELERIPLLHVDGLSRADAGVLLDRVARIRLDTEVRDRVLVETAGNPLAILEFSQLGDIRRIGGGYRIPMPGRIPRSIELGFSEAVKALSSPSRKLLLLAAAEPTGDPTLLRRAALARGITVPESDEQALERLVQMSPQVRFRHPLVRSAVYGMATDTERRAAHGALATALADGSQSDRRVWHLAQSLDGPDENVAAALEMATADARSRGGLAAAAEFLSRAAQITPDSAVRARRELHAAMARFESGDADGALSFLASAQARGLDALMSAQAKLLRGEIELYLRRGGNGPALLLDAARALRGVDPTRARETYLEAVQAAGYADVLPIGVAVSAIARAALAEAPPAEQPRPVDLLLQAVASFYAHGAADATAAARLANEALLAAEPSAETMRWTVLGGMLAFETFDDELLFPLAERAAKIARETGMVSLFVMSGWVLVGSRVLSGDLVGADALLQEVIAIAKDIGAAPPEFAVLALRAWRGQREDFGEMANDCREEARRINEGHVIRFIDGITALLHNGLEEHGEALDDCKRMLSASNPTYGLVVAFEYAESAYRVGTQTDIEHAWSYLDALSSAGLSGWSRGLHSLAAALLNPSTSREELFREAIAELEATRMRPYSARSHLLFGDWLINEGRLAEGRAELRVAYDALTDMGLTGFAAQAGRKAGLSRMSHHPALAQVLTAQEFQIAQFAANGMSNHDIAAQLYLSHRTVASHLYRIFPKLGITSRGQLHVALHEGFGT